jgi:carbon monoxide dehydrogenase subunit G
LKVEERIEVAATPAEAFAKVSDTALLTSLLSGLMDCYPTSSPNRFRTVIRTGPAPIGGEIEIEFWPEAGTVVWHSTRGLQQLGRLLVRPRPIGSEVVLRVYWHLDGGIASRLAELAGAVIVRRFAREALARLRHSIEAMPPRPRRHAPAGA